MHERKDRQGHQHHAQDQVEGNLTQIAPNKARLIADDRQRDIRREHRFQLGHPSHQSVDQPHGVGSALLANHQGDRVGAIQPGQCPRLLDVISDLGHLTEVNGLPTRIGDDQALEGSHGLHPAQRSQHPLTAGLLHPATRDFYVLLHQGLADITDIEAELAEAIGVHGHLHRPHPRSDQLNRPNILHGFQVLLETAVHQKGQFLEVPRRADCHRKNRGRVHLELVHNGHLCTRGESREDRVDLVPDVLGGQVSITLQEELRRDRRHPFPAGGTQFLNAFHGVDDFLHRLSDARLDLLGRGTPQGGADSDNGELHIGNLLDPQFAVSKPPHNDQQEVEHRSKNRPPDADIGQPAPRDLFFRLWTSSPVDTR